jgi:hypothetical protein
MNFGFVNSPSYEPSPSSVWESSARSEALAPRESPPFNLGDCRSHVCFAVNFSNSWMLST